ncbi:unnamed protein product [Scytosiphon promiscuus]
MMMRSSPAARAAVACAVLLSQSPCGWGSTTPSLEPTKAITLSDGGPAVSKTVFSNKMRLVFIAGLEGAGHHYITGATQAIFREHPSPPFNGTTMLQNGRVFYLPMIMGKSSASYSAAIDKARGEMRSIAQYEEQLPYPGTFYYVKGRSFPTGRGLHRVMQYMDPRLIAEAAEAEGVDLRVLYLKRSAKELLLADTVHRQFQNYLGKPQSSRTPQEKLFMENLRIMLTDAAVVHSFLAELDPAFTVCHDWHSFGDSAQAQKIAHFVAPSPEVASVTKQALVNAASGGSRHDTNETLPFDLDDVLSSRLQQKLDSFEHFYCG